MAIRLRFSLHGTRHNRIFHLVAVDQRKRRDAKPAELLGIYDRHLRNGETQKTVQWSVDRIRYWLHVGAIPTRSVAKLLELGNILPSGHIYQSHTAGAPPSTKNAAEERVKTSGPST